MRIEHHLHRDEQERTWGNSVPSGLFALEIDTDTGCEDGLSDAQLIDAMVGFERLAAWAGARQARLLAEFARRRPGDDQTLVATDRPCAMSRFAPDEVGLALKLSRMSAKARLGRAQQLEQVLPETLRLWQLGRLDERRVGAIYDTTHYLSTDKARAVQHRVLDRAPEQTLAQLKAALKRAIIHVDPEGAAQRHRAARRDRRVSMGEEQDGMASLWALLSAPDAQSSFQWLTRLARGCGKDDPRGMDARRADLMVELLTGRLTWAAPEPDTDSDTGAGAGAGAGADSEPDCETGAATEDGTETGTETGAEAGAGTEAEGGAHTGTAGEADPAATPAASDAAASDAASSGAASSGAASSGAASSGAAGSETADSAAAGAGGPAPPGERGGGSGSPPRPVNPGKPLVQVLTAPRGALSYLL